MMKIIHQTKSIDFVDSKGPFERSKKTFQKGLTADENPKIFIFSRPAYGGSFEKTFTLSECFSLKIFHKSEKFFMKFMNSIPP